MAARTRFHGWHWWRGIGNDRTWEGKRPIAPQWWAVYCWTHEGVGYATSACWREPLKQSDMDPSGWNSEIMPPGSGTDKKRPPVALMTASAAMHEDVAVLKKMADAGYEVVIVQDADFEKSLKIVEKVRKDSLREFQRIARARR